jgi:hypothetical protein
MPLTWVDWAVIIGYLLVNLAGKLIFRQWGWGALLLAVAGSPATSFSGTFRGVAGRRFPGQGSGGRSDYRRPLTPKALAENGLSQPEKTIRVRPGYFSTSRPTVHLWDD